MTDLIEEMKKAGWVVAYIATPEYSPQNEAITFHRPRQKPNAIVDFEIVEKLLNDIDKDFPNLVWKLQPFVPIFRKAIKKVE